MTAVSRRSFEDEHVRGQETVFVASGRSSVGRDERFPEVLRDELSHLRRVLDACARAEVARVVVLGSSDVTGLARHVSGDTPQAPLTPYARVKAALEDECRLRAGQGLPVTSVRLAPVHGPGKSRTAEMVRLARSPVIPLPGGGRHSIGFVLMQDALTALRHLGSQAGPAVVSVGGGPTALRDLLGALAKAQGRSPWWLPVPVPGAAARALSGATLPETLHWVLRQSLPRVVAMEVDVPVTPIPTAAAALVASC